MPHMLLHKVVAVLLLAFGLIGLWLAARDLVDGRWNTNALILFGFAAVFMAGAAGMWRLSRPSR